MDINDSFREIIVKEINYATNKMGETSDLREKLFYFTAVYNVIHRIFNLEYDPDLVYLHFILQETYKAFVARLHAMQREGEEVIPLTEEHFQKLIRHTKQLAANIRAKKGIDDILKKLVLLSYTTTGNGFYLAQKGLLKV